LVSIIVDGVQERNEISPVMGISGELEGFLEW
jgi:hypothetical protein